MFALEGVFLRGGIANGRHFENRRMIFSEALVRAYDLESRVAVYPKILVSPDVYKRVRACRYLVREDKDGSRFVDYLEWCRRQHSADGDHPYDIHRTEILKGLSRNRANRDVRRKYLWTARYHNKKIRELLRMPPDEVGSIKRSMLIPGDKLRA
jgi:hypothetical protein